MARKGKILLMHANSLISEATLYIRASTVPIMTPAKFDKKKNALKTHKGTVKNNRSPKKKFISLKTDLLKFNI